MDEVDGVLDEPEPVVVGDDDLDLALVVGVVGAAVAPAAVAGIAVVEPVVVVAGIAAVVALVVVVGTENIVIRAENDFNISLAYLSMLVRSWLLLEDEVKVFCMKMKR